MEGQEIEESEVTLLETESGERVEFVLLARASFDGREFALFGIADQIEEDSPMIDVQIVEKIGADEYGEVEDEGTFEFLKREFGSVLGPAIQIEDSDIVN